MTPCVTRRLDAVVDLILAAFLGAFLCLIFVALGVPDLAFKVVVGFTCFAVGLAGVRLVSVWPRGSRLGSG